MVELGLVLDGEPKTLQSVELCFFLGTTEPGLWHLFSVNHQKGVRTRRWSGCPILWEREKNPKPDPHTTTVFTNNLKIIRIILCENESLTSSASGRFAIKANLKRHRETPPQKKHVAFHALFLIL